MSDSIPVPIPREGGLVPPPAVSVSMPPARHERFSFTGRTGEYFRIWIVNLFLTIVTVGLYSPWAKVRKKRYVYGNTWVAGSNFEYHGNPVAILKGRLLAFSAFAAYSLATHYSPRFAAAIALAVMPAAPWLVMRSFAFNAVNSSYRNIRFHFDGRYREALAALAPLALVPALTLVLPQLDRAHPPRDLRDMWFLFIPSAVLLLVYPYVSAKVKLLHVNRARFGTSAFRCGATVGAFYGIYALAVMLSMVLVFVLGIVVAASAFLGSIAMMAAIPLGYLAVGAFLFAFTRAQMTNLVFNATRLDGRVALKSTITVFGLARIYALNLVAISLTVGFAVPWAVMRTLRYRAEHLALAAQDDIESFVAGVTRDVAAAGEEMGEMFDVDLSL
jgi:uncharacterized membrane protein YjgN (DUF898 family)